MQDILLSVLWVYVVFSLYRRRVGYVYDITFNLIPLLVVLYYTEFVCDTPINNAVRLLVVTTLVLCIVQFRRLLWVSVLLLLLLSLYYFSAIYAAFTIAVVIPLEVACLFPQKRNFKTTTPSR